MRSFDALQMAVAAPQEGIRVVWVAGDLDEDAAPRLVRLTDTLVRRLGADGGPAHLVLDLACVRHFGVGGVEALRHVEYGAVTAGVGLHLTGVAARAMLLPLRVAGLLTGFSTFGTVDDALRTLGAGRARPAETAR